MTRARRRLLAILAAGLVAAGIGTEATASATLSLFSSGVAGVAVGPDPYRLTLPPAATGEYLPGSGVLAGTSPPAPPPAATPSGYALDPPSEAPRDVPTAGQLAARSRSWLAGGAVPGRTGTERDVATRALLDLALLTSPSGASVAAAFGPWDLVWPRDASWHVAAFAVTGHQAEALATLRFLARAQDADGTWAARYHPDGSPVTDGRDRQLDAVGWVPWAVWMWWQQAGPDDEAALAELWPMVAAAADAATRSLQPDGLPRASADYWEQPETRRTIGTAAPLLLGLRAAADLADALGETGARERWVGAARRLDAAIGATFGATGFRRHPSSGAGPDSALTFLAAPLAPLTSPAGERVPAALRRAAAELLMPSGGLRPGNIPRVGDVAWTPATALFALTAAGADDEAGFRRWFDWLATHRTALGALPEKVTDSGEPASVAPLGWTASIVLLALAARDGDVPAPPAPPAS